MADLTTKLAEALQPFVTANNSGEFETLTVRTTDITKAREALRLYEQAKAQTKQAAEPVAEPHTEFVLNELRSALNAMLTFFGMDEDESNKEVFDKARQAYNYAQIVMRPLEPWERQSLKDLRDCVGRWHEKAVAKGYDGVESMCDTAPAQAQQAEVITTAASLAAMAVYPEGHSWDRLDAAVCKRAADMLAATPAPAAFWKSLPKDKE